MRTQAVWCTSHQSGRFVAPNCMERLLNWVTKAKYYKWTACIATSQRYDIVLCVLTSRSANLKVMHAHCECTTYSMWNSSSSRITEYVLAEMKLGYLAYAPTPGNQQWSTWELCLTELHKLSYPLSRSMRGQAQYYCAQWPVELVW